MINLVAIKALAGFNYVRVDQVIAISATESAKCNVIMSGGISVPCQESAKDVLARLEAATRPNQE